MARHLFKESEFVSTGTQYIEPMYTLGVRAFENASVPDTYGGHSAWMVEGNQKNMLAKSAKVIDASLELNDAMIGLHDALLMNAGVSSVFSAEASNTVSLKFLQHKQTALQYEIFRKEKKLLGERARHSNGRFKRQSIAEKAAIAFAIAELKIARNDVRQVRINKLNEGAGCIPFGFVSEVNLRQRVLLTTGDLPRIVKTEQQ